MSLFQKMDGEDDIQIFAPGEKPAAPAPAEDDVQIFAPPPPSSVAMDTNSEQSMSQDSAMSVSQSSSEAANANDLDSQPVADAAPEFKRPMDLPQDEGLGEEEFQPASEGMSLILLSLHSFVIITYRWLSARLQ